MKPPCTTGSTAHGKVHIRSSLVIVDWKDVAVDQGWGWTTSSQTNTQRNRGEGKCGKWREAVAEWYDVKIEREGTGHILSRAWGGTR